MNATDLAETFEQRLEKARVETALTLLREVASTTTLNKIVEYISSVQDRDALLNMSPVELFGLAAPAVAAHEPAPTPAAAPAATSAAAEPRPRRGRTRNLTLPLGHESAPAPKAPKAPPRVGATKAEKAANGKAANGKASAYDAAVAQFLAKVTKGTSFKTGAILSMFDNPAAARTRVTSLLNEQIAAGKLRRHGGGRSAFYEVV